MNSPLAHLPWLLCGLLALGLLYFLGLYYYTRGLLEALCEPLDSVRLKCLKIALDRRFACFLFAPVLFLLDLLSASNLDAVHPERGIRRARDWAQELRATGDEGPGQTSPLLAHGEALPLSSAQERALRRRQNEAWIEPAP